MLGIVAGITLAVSLLAMADVATSYSSELRSLTRHHWLRAVLVPVLGPILWALYGRPRLVKAPPAPTSYWIDSSATDDNPAYIAYLARVVAGRLRRQIQD
jgi:hypothetical protein